MDVLTRLEIYKDNASVAEQGLLDYILANPDTAAESSVHELSRMSYCSASTIVRMCRKLGFEGYRDMRMELQCELAIRKKGIEQKLQQLEESDEMGDIIQGVTYDHIASLEESARLIAPDTLAKCADLLSDSKSLLLFGLGESRLIAQSFSWRMGQMGKSCSCSCSDEVQNQYEMAGKATSEDVGIIISYSGETEEMVRCAELLQEQKTPVIAVTRKYDSPLSKAATVCLYVKNEEQDGLFLPARLAQLNALDILYTAYSVRNKKVSERQK